MISLNIEFQSLKELEAFTSSMFHKTEASQPQIEPSSPQAETPILDPKDYPMTVLPRQVKFGERQRHPSGFGWNPSKLITNHDMNPNDLQRCEDERTHNASERHDPDEMSPEELACWAERNERYV